MNSQKKPRAAWTRPWTVALSTAAMLGGSALLSGGCVDNVAEAPTAKETCGQLQTCDGKCVDLRNDPNHCGGCINPCSAGEICTAGACSVACAGGTTSCQGKCVDAQNDVSNCGACGTKCGAGEVCSAGKCGLNCAGGSTQCAGTCVDAQNDPQNCGACDAACAAGEVCAAGKCALDCVGGSTKCGGKCVDTTNNPQNCGSCAAACPAVNHGAGVCVAGSCGSSCNAGFADCDSDPANGCEVDTTTDLNHCGGCGTACAPAANEPPSCTAGVCGLSTCNAGFADCDSDQANGCEADLTSDAANCNSCGNACAAGQGCNAGVCACPNAGTLCAGVCVDTQTDPANCNGCGNACASNQACSSGACSCAANFGDCDMNPANGCEADLTTDPNNCGACNAPCPAGSQCDSGACSVAATLFFAGDDSCEAYVDGVLFGTSPSWSLANKVSFKLTVGPHVVAVKGMNAANGQNPGAMILDLAYGAARLSSDATWDASTVQSADWEKLGGSLSMPVAPSTYGDIFSPIWWNRDPVTFAAKNFPDDSSANWVWSAGFVTDSVVYFRKEFTVP